MVIIFLSPRASYSFGYVLCIGVLLLEQCEQIFLSGTLLFSMMLLKLRIIMLEEFSVVTKYFQMKTPYLYSL